MKRFVLFTLLAALLLAACAPAAAPTAEPTAPIPMTAATEEPTAEPTATTAPTATEAPQTIVDIAAADDRFTTLVAAVQAAGLAETLAGDGPYTVFAPTNDAFAALPEGTLDELLLPENKQALANILLYHVVPGKVMAADVAGLTEAETALGENVAVTVEGGKVFINEAEVLITDIEASNGVIHVIDSVILPPADEAAAEPTMNIVEIAAADEQFSTLVAAVQAAGLAETLSGEGPYTVFAPTNDAFAALPEGTVENLLLPENKQALTDILLYHVVPGTVMSADLSDGMIADSALGTSLFFNLDMGDASVNEANIVAADIPTTNGVIHVIDSVILPKDIVAAAAYYEFNTLAAALEAAGLVETLQGEGPFTVFAPTDEAFAALPEGTLEELLLPENKQTLTDILTYHVVSGSVLAEDVVELDSATTVNGAPVTITVEDGKVFVNDAEVTVTDIKTTNGVIHVIDAVILPPQ